MFEAPPKIGLTLDFDSASGRYELPQSYVAAVERAGGLPIALPLVRRPELISAMLDLCNGVVITGGAFDIPPELYGEESGKHSSVQKAERTEFEWAVCREALGRGMPLLGVCGGMQLLNVVLGGSLWQDIPAQLGLPSHEQPPPKDTPFHPVDIVSGSLLASLVGGEPLPVNSTHHQAVKKTGAGLAVSGLAPDGVIEAIELPGTDFVLGVQWHPEAVARHEPRHDKIYRGLVRAAAEYALLARQADGTNSAG